MIIGRYFISQVGGTIKFYSRRPSFYQSNIVQALGEDWEMPTRMLEFQEALENYTAVILRLLPLDDTPHNIRRTLLYNNYGGQAGEDEKSRLR
jgi:hypothetical protein